jgi:hypothetical protein
MPISFISEPIVPLEASFDTSGMARGEPGLPRKFRWRKTEYIVAEVLEQGKDYGDCRHGSGERYVRKHVYRVQTMEGPVLRIYFQRTFGKSRPTGRSRWWVYSVE